MMNKRAFLALGGAALITTACATPAPEVKAAGLVSKGYQISNVTVVLAKDAAVGRFAKDPALTKNTVESINKGLTAKLVKPKTGMKKAKLNIEITNMALHSAGGRTLTGIANQIVGNVVAKDKAGKIIMAQQIAFAEAGTHNGTTVNGIPLGALFSAIANASKSGNGDDVKAIVDGFNGKVSGWVAS